MPKHSASHALITAADAIIMAGGPTKLAQAITRLMPDDPISQSAVTQWQYKVHGLVPTGRAKAVAKILGVGRERIRPDLYGDDDDHLSDGPVDAAA